MTALVALGASTIGSALTLPLDFIKVQRQVGGDSAPFTGSRWVGVDLCVVKTLSNLLLRSLIGVSLGSSENKSLCFFVPVVATLLTPIDNALVKMQTQHLFKGVNLTNGVEALRYASAHGLFRGAEATLLKASAYTFGALYLGNLRLGSEKDYYAGLVTFSIASFFGTVLSLPFDNVRVNLQKCTGEITGSEVAVVKQFAGFSEAFSYTYNKLGIFGFYRGFVAALTRNIIGFGISFSLVHAITNE